MSDESNRYGDGTVFEGVRSKDSVIPTLQTATDLEGPHGVVTQLQAAEELRRLQDENFELAAGQCSEGGPWGDEGGTPYCKLKEELRRLTEVNQVLLAACESAEHHSLDLPKFVVEELETAIAKAKGESNE